MPKKEKKDAKPKAAPKGDAKSKDDAAPKDDPKPEPKAEKKAAASKTTGTFTPPDQVGEDLKREVVVRNSEHVNGKINIEKIGLIQLDEKGMARVPLFAARRMQELIGGTDILE
jgi:hypothetical protein